MDEDLDISDITSLASSLLYEGSNKSSKLSGQKLAQIQLLDLQFFAPSWLGTTLQSTVTSGPNMVRCFGWCGQIWRKGQFFSPAMAVFRPIGSLLYMAGVWRRYCYCVLMRCPPDDDDDNASDDNGENHDETPRRWIVTISLHCYG